MSFLKPNLKATTHFVMMVHCVPLALEAGLPAPCPKRPDEASSFVAGQSTSDQLLNAKRDVRAPETEKKNVLRDARLLKSAPKNTHGDLCVRERVPDARETIANIPRPVDVEDTSVHADCPVTVDPRCHDLINLKL